ncbi:hypothetical protein RKD27_008481 [Streptomyces sp. SAI-126]
MSASSSSATRCLRPPGSVGSTVSANRVLSVLAGGSLRWASCAASTSPLWASATTHDSADTSGTRGAPRCGRTWVPERYSRAGDKAAACRPPGAPGSEPGWAAAVAEANTSTPVVHRAQAETAIREGNPIVIPQS